MRPRARIYMYFVSYRRVRVRERESERARERDKNGTRLEGLGYGGGWRLEIGRDDTNTPETMREIEREFT